MLCYLYCSQQLRWLHMRLELCEDLQSSLIRLFELLCVLGMYTAPHLPNPLYGRFRQSTVWLNVRQIFLRGGGGGLWLRSQNICRHISHARVNDLSALFSDDVSAPILEKLAPHLALHLYHTRFGNFHCVFKELLH